LNFHLRTETHFFPDGDFLVGVEFMAMIQSHWGKNRPLQVGKSKISVSKLALSQISITATNLRRDKIKKKPREMKI